MERFFLLTFRLLVLLTTLPSKAEACEKTFGDSSKYQDLFKTHFESIDFKVCTDKLKLKEKEISESSLQQLCDCMKTSIDTSLCDTKADILLLDKCLACTQKGYTQCLNINYKSPVGQVIWERKKNKNQDIPVVFAFTSGVAVAALVFLLSYSCCLYRTRANTVSEQQAIEMSTVN